MARSLLALAGLALTLAMLAMLAPAVARASSASASGGAAPSSAGSGDPAGSGGALSVTGPAWLGGPVRIQGNLGAGAAHQPVLIERQGAGGGRWIMTARAAADAHGSFTAVWRARQAGRLTLRAQVQSHLAGTAQSAPAAATGALTVYRPAVATWYGPGSFGRRTACGERLTRQLLGVASRTLPCGTLVEISYRGRTVTVPVVDRGPYTSATWDLTWATAMQLGFSGRQRIGTAIVGRAQSGATPGGGPSSPAPSGAGSGAQGSGSSGSGSAAGGAVAGP